jgi:ABC-type uncharacterized transport system substrate-binding protein
MGWAQNLARPGGMITGVFEAGSNAKRFELLKEVRPQAATFGFLLNATNPINPLTRKGVDYLARTLGINIEIIEVKDQSELANAFDHMKSLGVEGLSVNPDPVFGSNIDMLVELARIHKLPTVFEGALFVVSAGGLFAFTNDYLYLAKRSASYVDQILKGAASSRVALSLKAATSTIPIVGVTSDPVTAGIVSDLSRPGGNITGVSVDSGPEIWGKRLEFLREVSPRIHKVGNLASRAVWESRGISPILKGARKLGLIIAGPPLEAPFDEPEYRRIFAAMASDPVDALLVGDQPEHFVHKRLIVELAEKTRLPAIYSYRWFVALGGLYILRT